MLSLRSTIQSKIWTIIDSDLRIIESGDDLNILSRNFRKDNYCLIIFTTLGSLTDGTLNHTLAWWEGSNLGSYSERLHDTLPNIIQSLCSLAPINNVHHICQPYRDQYSFLRSLETSKFKLNNEPYPTLQNNQWLIFGYDNNRVIQFFHGSTIPTIQKSFNELHSYVILYKRNENEYVMVLWEGNRTRPIEKCKFISFYNFIYLQFTAIHKKIRIVKFNSNGDFTHLCSMLRNPSSIPSSPCVSNHSSPNKMMSLPSSCPSTCPSTPDQSIKDLFASLPQSPARSFIPTTPETTSIVQDVTYTGYETIVEAMNEFNNGAINWILLGYNQNNAKSLSLLGKGTNGVKEMKELLREESTAFGVIRVMFKDERLEHLSANKKDISTKTMFVQWLGKKSKPIEKARRTTHIQPVYSMFKARTIVHGELEADELDDLSNNCLLQKLNTFRSEIQYKSIVEA